MVFLYCAYSRHIVFSFSRTLCYFHEGASNQKQCIPNKRLILYQVKWLVALKKKLISDAWWWPLNWQINNFLLFLIWNEWSLWCASCLLQANEKIKLSLHIINYNNSIECQRVPRHGFVFRFCHNIFVTKLNKTIRFGFNTFFATVVLTQAGSWQNPVKKFYLALYVANAVLKTLK